MSPQRRQRLHGRVGEALERSGTAPVSELAHHFTRGGRLADAEKAVAYASQAGDEAAALFAHEAAAEDCSRAVEVLSRFFAEDRQRRCELLLAVGEARVRSGERVLARSAFREAATLAEGAGGHRRLGPAAPQACDR